MIGRVILAVILAGIAAGFVMGVIQHVRLTPMIIEAEAYERAGATHSHDAAAPATAESPAAAGGHDHDHGDDGWKPAEGWQRTLSTTVSSLMQGAGFAAILAAVSLITGLPINRQNGWIWGLCAFLAMTLAPAAGLPPELPGMPTADLFSRQVWWVATAALTAAGIYLLAARRESWAIVPALVMIAAPHVIGAPLAVHSETQLPPGLAAAFAANSIAANAVLWMLTGLFLGLVLDRTAKDIYAT